MRESAGENRKKRTLSGTGKVNIGEQRERIGTIKNDGTCKVRLDDTDGQMRVLETEDYAES